MRAAFRIGLAVVLAGAGFSVVTSMPSADVQLTGTSLTSKDLEPTFAVNLRRFEQLFKGEEKLSKEDQDGIAKLAKYYVFRNAWHNETPKVGEKTLPAHAKKFDDLMTNLQKAKNPALANAFAASLVDAFKEVLSFDFKTDNVSIVNAAVLLPAAAKTESEVFGDFLAEELIAKPNYHDTVRLFAFKALGDFMPARLAKANDPPAKVQRDQKRIDAVLNFLKQGNVTKLDEKAWKFIRREAVAALSDCRLPAAQINQGKVVGPAAHGMLQILDPSARWSPLPTPQEKCDAAVGICRLQAQEGYKPEVGVYLVGQFLVEFIDAYRQDFSDFKKQLEPKKDVGLKWLPKYPWKIQADRLDKGLKEWSKNLGPAQKDLAPKVDEMAKLATGPLGSIKTLSLIANPPAALKAEADKLFPLSGAIYQDNKELVIELKKAP